MDYFHLKISWKKSSHLSSNCSHVYEFFAVVAQKQLAVKLYYALQQKYIAKNIVTILLRLPAIYRKHVFAISSHIYQTVSQDYLLLHKISVPQSFAKHGYPNITRISAKASAASHVTNWQQKSIWEYTATIITRISPNSGHQTKKSAH